MSIFAELKRRNVLRAAAFYAASAWLLVQVATQAPHGLQRESEISPNESITRQTGKKRAPFLLGYMELKEGKTDRAADYFRGAPAAFSRTGLAMVEYSRGHERESQQFMTELKEKYAVGFAYQIAQAYTWRGDRDGAFEWLEHACDQRDARLYRLRYDPMLANMRDDPRFCGAGEEDGTLGLRT